MKTFLIFAMMIVSCTICKAQIAQFEALYIYNFAKNIEWNDNSKKELVITVVGNKELASELKKLAKSRSIDSKCVVINESTTTSNITNSDIICVGEARCKMMKTLVAEQRDNNVLVVSCSEGNCQNGASISFAANDGKLQYQISDKNIQRHGLSVNTKLMSLGIAVD